jgi:hypothetical protein
MKPQLDKICDISEATHRSPMQKFERKKLKERVGVASAFFASREVNRVVSVRFVARPMGRGLKV